MAELAPQESKGKKGKKKHRSKKSSTRVDLTPMVDLGFLLVTFFMLTTTFSKPQTMEINMPVKPKDVEISQQDQPQLKASNALTIIISGENKLFWYMGIPDKAKDENLPVPTNFSQDGIRKIILNKVATIKDLMVLIKASDEASYKNVVDILDEMNICNAKRYAIVDITPVDLDLIQNL
jgi:biopolymer transport protein ExbD